MPNALPDLRQAVKTKLQSRSPNVGKVEFGDAIADAIRQVSIDSPYGQAIDIVGDGTKSYPLPVSFIPGLSEVAAVESPAGEDPPRYIKESDDWFLYEDPTQPVGQRNRLRFLTHTPATGSAIRISLCSEHVVSEDSSTLNPKQFLAVQWWALCLIYRGLASRFAETHDALIQADAVDYAGRTQNYLFLAERFCGEYKKLVGLIGGQVKAAQATAERDLRHRGGRNFVWWDPRER